MPLTLLPATAAAFAPRSAPTIILGAEVEPWLTQSLKRINRVKRPLNSSRQHERSLVETLAGPKAIWTLACLMLPKAPDSELLKSEDALVEAMSNYQLVHVHAYVVHIDMISEQEVSFKLTPESISALITYHRDIYCVDIATNTWVWSEKDAQLKKLHADFVAATNRYVFRSHVKALEGMEDDGAGELLEGRSEEVKNAILALFLPLLPPPPPVLDVMHSPPPMPVSHISGQWWPALNHGESFQTIVEPWQVLGSMTLGTPASAPECRYEVSPTNWLSPPLLDETHYPSPTPSYDHSRACSELQHSRPLATAPVPTLPLPSVIAQQCGINSSAAGLSSNVAWTYNDLANPYPLQT